MAMKLRSILAGVRKFWHEEYFQFQIRKDVNRQKMAPFTKSCILPRNGDYMLIKEDNELEIRKVRATSISGNKIG